MTTTVRGVSGRRQRRPRERRDKGCYACCYAACSSAQQRIMKGRRAVKQRQQHRRPASLISDIKAFLLIVDLHAVSCIYCALRRL